ncbi:MAG: ABC transporter substrate-binding protein [Nostoc sp.]|uniref:caspase, EACC1-associated type n=1 Tax=Nostoc sp. TaxID=1180 RepID=UPI002FF74344
MAKVALLIGVSEYEPGLTPLPAATKDVEAMQQVLLHPEIGGFDEVKVLLNPQQHEMAVAIEILFDDRQKDDLVLLFFSGHGIKDEDGKLYFAAHNTRKTGKGVPARATTVPASFVHDVMNKSRSKREVVILDCCFSGAFAEGMSPKSPKDEGFVDVKNQLGGEGRAVLTSSTSTQYSFEQQGTDTSTYTRYIVEGLKTGAADRDEDGWISVDELHEYAKSKVQEASPAMNPEIYAIREGYKINLAKAPSNDPMLTYHREVNYWVEGGNGKISVTGRAALEGLQETLKLSPEQAAAIETQVLAPIEDKKRKLQRYELAFRDEIKQGFPLSDRTAANLKRLQQTLGLRDEDIALIEAPIIAALTNSSPVDSPRIDGNNNYKRHISEASTELLAPSPLDSRYAGNSYFKRDLIEPPNRDPVDYPPSGNSNFKRYIGACIIGIFIGVTTVVHIKSTANSCASKQEYSLGDKISWGEEILVRQYIHPYKQIAVKAFLNSNCQLAVDEFNLYRSEHPRDPEALIYLNNAEALKKDKQIKIAVSVPITNKLEVAEEILRGVAQVQNEVNHSGGINGKLLQVVIADDNNDPTLSSNIAQQFVSQPDILAVVGHNASEASLSASLVYSGKLVMISPTSFAPEISNKNYIFRTAPDISLEVDKLSSYAINEAKKKNFLICTDSSALDNNELKEKFAKKIDSYDRKVKVNNTICDISAPDFNANKVISQAINSGADGLILTLHREKIQQGVALAREAKRGLALFGIHTLYLDTGSTLNDGKDDFNFNGMVVATPSHSKEFTAGNFARDAKQLWGAPANTWRTVAAYDATLAIVKGLQQSNTREGLQKVLYSDSFSVDGATGSFKFLPSGDRTNNSMFLVQVQQKAGKKDEYEFVPIQP